MQQIKVAEVFTKPTKKGGLFVKVTDDKGGTFSGFDEGLAKLNKGDVIQAEIEVQGQYTNIKSWTLSEQAPKAEVPVGQKQNSVPSGTREASIESQVAYKSGVELLIAGIVKPDSAFGRRILSWGYTHLPEVEMETLKALEAPLVKAIESVTGAKAKEVK